MDASDNGNVYSWLYSYRLHQQQSRQRVETKIAYHETLDEEYAIRYPTSENAPLPDLTFKTKFKPLFLGKELNLLSKQLSEIVFEVCHKQFHLPLGISSEIILYTLTLVPGIYDFVGTMSSGWSSMNNCTLRLILNNESKIIGGCFQELYGGSKDQRFRYQVTEGTYDYQTGGLQFRKAYFPFDYKYAAVGQIVYKSKKKLKKRNLKYDNHHHNHTHKQVEVGDEDGYDDEDDVGDRDDETPIISSTDFFADEYGSEYVPEYVSTANNNNNNNNRNINMGAEEEEEEDLYNGNGNVVVHVHVHASEVAEDDEEDEDEDERDDDMKDEYDAEENEDGDKDDDDEEEDMICFRGEWVRLNNESRRGNLELKCVNATTVVLANNAISEGIYIFTGYVSYLHNSRNNSNSNGNGNTQDRRRVRRMYHDNQSYTKLVLKFQSNGTIAGYMKVILGDEDEDEDEEERDEEDTEQYYVQRDQNENANANANANANNNKNHNVGDEEDTQKRRVLSGVWTDFGKLVCLFDDNLKLDGFFNGDLFIGQCFNVINFDGNKDYFEFTIVEASEKADEHEVIPCRPLIMSLEDLQDIDDENYDDYDDDDIREID